MKYIITLISFLVRISCYANRHVFIFKENIISYVFCKEELKLLFSQNDSCEEIIKNSFRFLPHKLLFSEFHGNNIAQYDLVIPLNIDDVIFLNNMFDLTGDHQSIPIPSKECLALCDDKLLLSKKLIENGYGDNIPKIGGNLKYPFVLKKKKDKMSQNTHIILSQSQESSILNNVNKDDYYKQELITGKCEYAANIFFRKRIVHSLTIKHHFPSEISIDGKSKKYSKVVKCQHLDLFSDILTSIGYQGLCCIDYKIKDGRPMIFEINPRFDGTLAPYFFSFLRYIYIERRRES